MRIEYTVTKCPATYALQEDCALPLGLCLQPFAPHRSIPLNKEPTTDVKQLTRCSDCGAYINCYAGLDAVGWRCIVCGNYNEFGQRYIKRYGIPDVRRQHRELSEQVYEVTCSSFELQSLEAGGNVVSGPFPPPRMGRPVFIFLLHLGAAEERVEMVKMALAAALEAMPPTALVGLITMSTHITLWDLKSAVPVGRSVAIFEDGAVMCPLEDALPLHCLLADAQPHRAAMLDAVDMLAPAPGAPLALGPVLDALADYLRGLMEQPTGSLRPRNGTSASPQEGMAQFGSARLMCFIASGPTQEAEPMAAAAAAVPPATTTVPPSSAATARASEAAAATGVPGASAVKFYQQLAVLFAMLGVTFDLFAYGLEAMSLAALGSLCEQTGGTCHLYNRLDNASLPQDLVQRVKATLALTGLLRVRTCPELRVRGAYGRLHEDPEHEQLYHIVSCDQTDCFSLGLELRTVHGFVSKMGGRPPQPVIQVAFQYSMLVHKTQVQEDDQGGRVTSHVYELQRRLRVCTETLDLGRTHTAIFSSARIAPVLTLLMHKATKHAAERGAASARALLQDWLVLFLSRWHHHIKELPLGQPPQPGHIDLWMGADAAMPSLATFVYALLRSAPLGPASTSQQDKSVFLRLLWGSLRPEELVRCIHPVMMVLMHPNDEPLKPIPLSRLSLSSARSSPIILVDAFSQLLVAYMPAAAAAGLPFPPPPDSKLREIVQSLRIARRPLPQVQYVPEGDRALQVEGFLIDDVDTSWSLENEVGLEAGRMGLNQWATFIEDAVISRIGSGGR